MTPGTEDRSVHANSLPLLRREASIVSPLRYPGAKRRLAGYIAEVLRLNTLRPAVFVEPFAGGASVALQLLNDGLVDMIALGERDPLVASFWKVVFEEPEWLISELERVEVTLESWKSFRTAQHATDRQRALACLFLNRTSFSGILAPSAGPIGGHAQASPYDIGCRFPVDTLTRRIRQAAALREQVLFVHQGEWHETIDLVSRRDYDTKDLFLYLDPPFYNKAERLYTHYFERADHGRLREELLRSKNPWVLSYDVAPEVIMLYSDVERDIRHVELFYSASSSKRSTSVRELIITNLSCLPSATRLWRSSQEWKKCISVKAPPQPNGCEWCQVDDGVP